MSSFGKIEHPVKYVSKAEEMSSCSKLPATVANLVKALNL